MGKFVVDEGRGQQFLAFTARDEKSKAGRKGLADIAIVAALMLMPAGSQLTGLAAAKDEAFLFLRAGTLTISETSSNWHGSGKILKARQKSGSI